MPITPPLLLICFSTLSRRSVRRCSRQQPIQRGQFGMKRGKSNQSLSGLNIHREIHTTGNWKSQQDLLVQVSAVFTSLTDSSSLLLIFRMLFAEEHCKPVEVIWVRDHVLSHVRSSLNFNAVLNVSNVSRARLEFILDANKNWPFQAMLTVVETTSFTS